MCTWKCGHREKLYAGEICGIAEDWNENHRGRNRFCGQIDGWPKSRDFPVVLQSVITGEVRPTEPLFLTVLTIILSSGNCMQCIIHCPTHEG